MSPTAENAIFQQKISPVKIDRGRFSKIFSPPLEIFGQGRPGFEGGGNVFFVKLPPDLERANVPRRPGFPIRARKENRSKIWCTKSVAKNDEKWPKNDQKWPKKTQNGKLPSDFEIFLHFFSGFFREKKVDEKRTFLRFFALLSNKAETQNPHPSKKGSKKGHFLIKKHAIFRRGGLRRGNKIFQSGENWSKNRKN